MTAGSRQTFQSLLAAHTCLLDEGFFSVGPGAYAKADGERRVLHAARAGPGRSAVYEILRERTPPVARGGHPATPSNREIALYREAAALGAGTAEATVAKRTRALAAPATPVPRHGLAPAGARLAPPRARLVPDRPGAIGAEPAQVEICRPPLSPGLQGPPALSVRVSVVNVAPGLSGAGPGRGHQWADVAARALSVLAVMGAVAILELIRFVASA